MAPDLGLAAPSASNRKMVFLLPGATWAGAQPTVVTTVLGSCVAVCLWDSRRGLGGMNHFALPHWDRLGASSGRFGDVACEQLLGQMRLLGSKLADLSAHVFGGGRLFSGTVGAANATAALELLRQRNVPVRPVDVGGTVSRKLSFLSDAGIAFVKRLK